MEKEYENHAEELSPFLQSFSHPKDGIRNHSKRSILTLSLAVLLAISLCSNILMYLYINNTSYLDAACILHTQQNRTSSSYILLVIKLQF